MNTCPRNMHIFRFMTTVTHLYFRVWSICTSTLRSMHSAECVWTLSPHPQSLSLAERMERAVYLGLDEKNITAKFVAGRKII